MRRPGSSEAPPHQPPVRLLLPALLVALAACAGIRPATEEWDHELPAGTRIDDSGWGGAEAARWLLPVRVVDDATGEGIAGARITNWWEAETPHAQPWAELREGMETTDRDGWALLPSGEHAPWYFVEAPGYGPHAEMELAEEYRLVRGVDFELEVRDWRDRPVPGAAVEAFLGCGHTPTVRAAAAGPDGRLVLPCIDPSANTDLWVLTPGLEGRNDAYWGYGPEGLPVRNGVHVILGDPSPTYVGRVLRADGTPAAGARVGTFASKRGPWTVADAEGRYRLDGAPPDAVLVAMAPVTDPWEEGRTTPQVSFRSRPGVVRTVTLPSRGRPYGEKEEPPREPAPEGPPAPPGLALRIESADDAIIDGLVRVLLVREETGEFRIWQLDLVDGVAEERIPVPSGSWSVTAGDVAGTLRPATRRVEVGEGWTVADFRLSPNPTWRPRIVERTADGGTAPVVASDTGRFLIYTKADVFGATAADADAADADANVTIRVPAAEPFAVEYGSDDGRRARVFLPRPPAGPGPTIVLPPRAPEEADAEPRKPAPDFPAATLTVLLPDGRPAAGAEVGTECVKGWWHGEFGGCLDDEGRTERDFDRGDRLRVTADPYGDDGGTVLPLTARIEGPGPWTIRWPTAEVVVRAVDESGAALPEFTVFLDTGQAPAAEEGAVRILGAGAGPLRLWVDAPGRRPHDLRLVLADGERREVVVRMNGDSAPGVSTRSPGPDLPRVAVADPPSRLALDRHAVDPLDQLPVPRPAAPDRQLERRAIRSHRQLELHRLPRGGRVHSPVLGDHGLSHLDSRGHSPFGPAYPVGTMPSNAR